MCSVVCGVCSVVWCLVCGVERERAEHACVRPRASGFLEDLSSPCQTSSEILEMSALFVTRSAT